MKKTTIYQFEDKIFTYLDCSHKNLIVNHIPIVFQQEHEIKKLC